jgi:hypothetical protein
MTSGHIFYIPIMIIIGLVVGYYLGRQAEEKAAAQHNERRQRRQRRPSSPEGEDVEPQ